MFGFGKKKEEARPELLAVQSGKIIDITTLPDPVFAEKMLGDGFAVVPEGNQVCSPCNGKIIGVQDSYHAYGIETDDGLEILVHIGINTVGLNGEGFSPQVKLGDKVKAGDILCIADLGFIKSKKLPTDIVVLITNIDDCTSVKAHYGNCLCGETVALEYVK